MITGFLTFVFFFAIVGCILYGRKLIKTEKVDAVFGNPERAQGGLHWVIVGSSFLLLVWLYYSWDMAKSFFPKSANELCQVGKINESLLSLKYLFPIEERQLKSTSVIETETKNLDEIIPFKYQLEIQNVWQNKYEIGHSQDRHMHTRAHFSFIVYENVDEGKTVFVHPINDLLMEKYAYMGIKGDEAGHVFQMNFEHFPTLKFFLLQM